MNRQPWQEAGRLSFSHVFFMSFRLSASLSSHPEKDELILFGGEFFNGKKVANNTLMTASLCEQFMKRVTLDAGFPNVSFEHEELTDGSTR